MNSSKLTDRVQFLGSKIEAQERGCLEALNLIGSIKSLAFKPICLPDLFYKRDTEAPASLVAATENTIIPTLTAPSLGCSMGVIKTSLFKNEITEEFAKNFYSYIQEETEKSYGFLENMLVWLGLKNRRLKKYDLTISQFEDIIKYGAKSAIKRYNLPESILEKLDNEGSLFTEKELNNLNLHEILPRSSFTNGRHNIGYGFKGNHFLEIQFVEDILDENTAELWGVKKNQVMVMYHGGGGMVAYHIGRYFANRRKNTFKQKFFLNIGKALFHFGSLEGLKNFRKRFGYYFKPGLFQEIPIDSPEGKRLMLATKASLNYSYSFSLAITRRIIDALKKSLPSKHIETELIALKIHNSIMKEKIKGKEVILHRHTANKVEEGKPVIVAGYNNTNSYIAVGLPGADNLLSSSDHGSGFIIKLFQKKGISRKHPDGYHTLLFKSKPPYKIKVEHITSEGVDYVVENLYKAGIIKPVLKLRPIAVFKG